MFYDTVYNDPEEVIVNAWKNILGTFWTEILFSPHYSYFHAEKLTFDMVTQIQGVGENSSHFHEVLS